MGKYLDLAMGLQADFNCEARHRDPYWQAAMRAWRQIASQVSISGATRWAKRNRPDLYHKVTRELPAQWEHLWDSGAPIDQFQAALNCWVEGHKQLQELYVSTRPKS